MIVPQYLATLTFSLRSVGGDCIEDVDEYEEESDEQSHSARDDIRRNHKTDPGHDNKQTCGQSSSMSYQTFILSGKV